jgi:hypothetical protein
MSVTFSLEGNFTGSFTAHCYESDVTLGPVEGYESIVPVIEAHKAACEECAAYGLYSQAVMDVSDALDVNVSNLNARTLLIALGLDDGEGDLCGSLDGEDFLGRVLLALATDRDDSGVASAVIGGREVGQSGATMIDCGVAPGYFADRFGALHALGQEAARLGRSVVWS